MDQATGRELRALAQGPKSDRIRAGLADIDADIADWVDDFAFGTIWSREGAAFGDRMVVAIVVLAALGHSAQMRTYAYGALHAGVDRTRVREALLMLTVYAGFPVSISAMQVWHEVTQSFDRQRGADTLSRSDKPDGDAYK